MIAALFPTDGPMWFRNLLPYRLEGNWQLSPGALETRLAERPLLPCSGLSMESRGWVSPREDAQLVYGQERQMLFALGTENKLLPASVVKDAVKEKAAQLEARMGFKPGKKQLRELREQIEAELLPRAFAKRRLTRVWVDPGAGWLVVDTASPKRGDEVLEQLRDTLGECPFFPLETEQSPVLAMSQWIAAGRAPGNFALDQDCVMKSSGDDPAAVRFARHSLEGDDVRRHVKDGKSVTQLGLVWNDRLRLMLAEPFVLRRVRFELIEQGRQEYDGANDNADEAFDADFRLMSAEFGELLAELTEQLGGPMRR